MNNRRTVSPLALALAACGAGALLSLPILPSAPVHDAWAWLVWGRELAHLDLNLSGGPAWKPLPVLLAAPLSATGPAAPWLWLAVARFGGLLSLVMGYRLAARVAGPAARAVAVTVLLSAWLRSVSMGISEGLVVALGLLALERHLDHRRGQAAALLFACALVRPEVWPFLGLYGAYLWIASPRLRVPVAVLLVLVPILWFAPDALVAGRPLRSAAEARSGGSAVGAGDVLVRAFELVALPVHLAAALALAFALRRGDRLVLALGAGAVAYVLVELALTAWGGYQGVARFLYPVLALEAILAGIGVRWLATGVAGVLAARAGRPGGGARLAGVVVALVLIPVGAWRAARLVAELEPVTTRAAFYRELDLAIERAGGSAHIRACGPVRASRLQAPAVAWRLGLEIPPVAAPPRLAGTVLRVAPSQVRSVASEVLPTELLRVGRGRYRRTAEAGPWEVLASYQSKCARRPPPSSGSRARKLSSSSGSIE
jgi:hypothetical protein